MEADVPVDIQQTVIDSLNQQNQVILESNLEDSVNVNDRVNTTVRYDSTELRALKSNFTWDYKGLWPNKEGETERIFFVSPKAKTLSGKHSWLTRLAENLGIKDYELQKEFCNQTVQNTIEFYKSNPEIADALHIDPIAIEKRLKLTNAQYPNSRGDPELLGNLLDIMQDLVVKPAQYSQEIQKVFSVSAVDPTYMVDNLVLSSDLLEQRQNDIEGTQDSLGVAQQEFGRALSNLDSYVSNVLSNLDSTIGDVVNAERSDNSRWSTFATGNYVEGKKPVNGLGIGYNLTDGLLMDASVLHSQGNTNSNVGPMTTTLIGPNGDEAFSQETITTKMDDALGIGFSMSYLVELNKILGFGFETGYFFIPKAGTVTYSKEEGFNFVGGNTQSNTTTVLKDRKSNEETFYAGVKTSAKLRRNLGLEFVAGGFYDKPKDFFNKKVKGNVGLSAKVRYKF